MTSRHSLKVWAPNYLYNYVKFNLRFKPRAGRPGRLRGLVAGSYAPCSLIEQQRSLSSSTACLSTTSWMPIYLPHSHQSSAAPPDSSRPLISCSWRRHPVLPPTTAPLPTSCTVIYCSSLEKNFKAKQGRPTTCLYLHPFYTESTKTEKSTSSAGITPLTLTFIWDTSLLSP